MFKTGSIKPIFKFFTGLMLLSALIFTSQRLPLLVALPQLKEALYYRKLPDKAVLCQLCPHQCTIKNGGRGYCGVRENKEGTLYSISFGKLVAIHIDPIEKKPLFHFLPSTTAFSIATAGCNLRCKFCQNWQISQAKPDELEYTYIEPQELVKKVKESGSPTIAYTYSEPVIFYEYMLETAKLAKAQGIKNIMHSSGYINEEPLRELAQYLDAANIDLKGFSNDYYAQMSSGTLAPVLRSLKVLKEAGVYLEVTNLVLPGLNDDKETLGRMCAWIKENLGADTPLHFSRFFPMYKLIDLIPTPVQSLEEARRIARARGLKYVYIGNLADNAAENTYCPNCGKLLIERKGYFILQNHVKEGKCIYCGEKIVGVWE